tara:strand:+ start:42 stop:707 length:666 start_codon:yes stop_codon:yes gene_type:complete
MSILSLFGIKEDAQPVDVIRGGKELKENIETKNQVLEDLMKENPDLVNNLNTIGGGGGGLTNIQPKAFTAFNNFYDQLTTPRIGNFGIMDLVSTGKFIANPSILGAAFSPIGAIALGALKGLGGLGGGLTGIQGGVDLRGDTGFDTFRRSTSFKDFFQRQRDKKAREEAARIGAAKQKAKELDYEYDAYTGGGGGGGFSEGHDAGASAAAQSDAAAGMGGY